MTNKTLEQAKYIFSHGRLLHEHILHIQTSFHAAQHSSKCNELTLPQIHAVKAIHQLGQATISQLAESLKVSLPSASVMVDRLVEKEIIIRTRSTQDRRKVEVCVVPQVEQEIQKLEKEILVTFIELVEKIGPESAQKWCEVLDKVGQALKEKGQKS